MSVDTLEPEHVGVLNSKTCFIVFANEDDGKGPGAKTAAEAAAATLPSAFTYFYAAGDLAGRVKDFVGLNKEETAIAVINVQKKQHFVFGGDVTDSDTVVAWAKDVEAGKAPLFVKSGERPPNDRDPEHPAVYKLVADSFNELVIESDMEFLVDLWADWCGPCLMVAPTLNILAEVFDDIPTINVGKLNVDDNGTDKDLFPEPHIPNMKFFSKKDKSKPIKYDGNRTLPDFVEFIHKNAETQFDLDQYKEKAKKLFAIDKERQNLRKKVNEVKELASLFNDAGMDTELLSQLKTKLSEAEGLLAKGGDANADDLRSHLVMLTAHKGVMWLEEKRAKAKIEEEKKALKNVIKVESDDDYDKEIRSAQEEGKVVIVDCFATWCGPCVYISPIFNDLSEKYSSLKFLKIDVDEQRRTAQALEIRAMPTFKVVKDGAVVDELVGADPDGLEKLIQKYAK